MKLLSSITGDDLKEFKRTAKERGQLGCTKNPGLFAIKLKHGISWRFRYQDVDGTRVVDTIASAHDDLLPQQAAERARAIEEMLRHATSPRLERAKRLQALREARQQADSNQYLNAGRYFEDIYTPYQTAHCRTGKSILNGIRNNFGHLFDRDMSMLSGADITAWFHDKRKQGVNRATLIRAFSAFKAMLNRAALPRDDSPAILATNPLKDVKLPRMTVTERAEKEASDREAQGKRNVISDETKAALRTGLDLFAERIRAQRRNSREHGKSFLPDLDVAAYPHWFIPFALVAWFTGMRPGDIRVMRWENIRHNRFSNKTLHTFTPEKTKDKGDSPAQVQFPVSGELLDVLTSWRKQLGDPQSGYVFPSERVAGGILDKNAYRRHWIKVKKFAGIDADLDFYAFRHNFISQLVMQGEPVLAIARLVGHKDGTMIAENYFHLGNQDADDIISRLGERLSGHTAPDLQEARA